MGKIEGHRKYAAPVVNSHGTLEKTTKDKNTTGEPEGLGIVSLVWGDAPYAPETTQKSERV